MTIALRHHYVVGYDITTNKRRTWVFKRLQSEGVPLQYSVFALEATPRTVDALVADLAALIDPTTDDVRIYPVARDSQVVYLGAKPVPDGVWFTGLDWLDAKQANRKRSPSPQDV